MEINGIMPACCSNTSKKRIYLQDFPQFLQEIQTLPFSEIVERPVLFVLHLNSDTKSMLFMN